MDTEKILVNQILQGNSECFTSLVNKYYPRIVTFIYKMNVSKEDAEDMAQEVFIKAYNNLYKYNDKWSFSTWLFKIAINTHKDFKKRKRVETKELTDNEVVSRFVSPDEYMDNIHQRELISDMFNSLNDDVRVIMILRYYQGLSLKEIGDVCKLSSEAVKMKISRAKNRLYKNFGGIITGGEYCEM